LRIPFKKVLLQYKAKAFVNCFAAKSLTDKVHNVERYFMKQIEISERKLTEHKLKQEEVGLKSKFDEIIEEIIDDCKVIRQILQEAEQAASTGEDFF
jgi:hypothetical protein